MKFLSTLLLLFCGLGFPNPAVFDAYLSPAIDDSLDPFSWSIPDLDLLRQYLLLTNGTM